MSASQKVPMSRAMRAARHVAEDMGLGKDDRDLAVLAELLAYHAGIELEEDR